jgi:hypothetical protein
MAHESRDLPFAMMPGQIQRMLSGTIAEARTTTTLGPCRFCSLLPRVAGGAIG